MAVGENYDVNDKQGGDRREEGKDHNVCSKLNKRLYKAVVAEKTVLPESKA